MADNISIERKDGVGGAYTEHYLGLWSGSPWTDVTAGLSDGVTYYYKSRRVIDGTPSGYSNEVSVVYSAISPLPGGRL